MMPNNTVRAYHLESGTVFTVVRKEMPMILMFENDVFYEVIDKGHSRYEPVYEKTGVLYTPNELNEMLKFNETNT